MSPNIVERPFQRFRRQRFGLARSYHFAAEAKATIDGADVRCLKQHAIRIAMDNSLDRSEEHTSELQSLRHLVCRLLLETKNNTTCPKAKPELQESDIVKAGSGPAEGKRHTKDCDSCTRYHGPVARGIH